MKLLIELSIVTAAFTFDAPSEAARILREYAEDLDKNGWKKDAILRDSDGHIVGQSTLVGRGRGR